MHEVVAIDTNLQVMHAWSARECGQEAAKVLADQYCFTLLWKKVSLISFFKEKSNHL